MPNHVKPQEVSDQLKPEEIASLDRRLNQLTPEERSVALLGFTEKMEQKRVPKGLKPVKIQISKDQKNILLSTLSKVAIHVTDSYSKIQNDNLTLTFLIPESLDLAEFLKINFPQQRKNLSLVIEPLSPYSQILSTPHDGLVILNPQTAQEQIEVQISKIGTEFPDMEIVDQNLYATAIYTNTTPASIAFAQTSKRTPLEVGKSSKAGLLALQLPQNPARQKELIDSIKRSTASSKIHIFSKGEVLYLVNTSERSPNRPKKMAKELSDNFPELKFITGSCVVNTTENNEFQIENLEEFMPENFESFEPGAYLKIDRKESERDSSLVEIITSKVPLNNDFLKITQAIEKVSLRSGGPESMVGYEKEILNLIEGLDDEKTDIIVLKGSAGMGKSRLLFEALKDFPNRAFTFSFDPAGKNIPYFGTALIFEQLITQLEEISLENPNLSTNLNPETLDLIGTFQSSNHDQKIEYAEKKSKQITLAFLEIMETFESEFNQKPILVFDDLHHADKYSTNHLSGLLYLLRDRKVKSVIAMREEEIEKNLERRTIVDDLCETNPESIQSIELKGLNFEDPVIAKKYVLSSLSEEFRQKFAEYDLGEEFTELIKKVGNWPFAMTTYLSILCENIEENIFAGADNKLHIRREALEKLSTINEKEDLANVLNQRINHLEPKLKHIAQVIALLGGKIPAHLLQELLGQQIFAELEENLRLLEDKKILSKIVPLQRNFDKLTSIFKKRESKDVYVFSHDLMRNAALESMNATEESTLSSELYAKIKDNNQIGPDIKLRLILLALSKKELDPNEPLWEELAARAKISFDESVRNSTHGRLRGLALEILNEKSQPIRQALEALKTGNANRGKISPSLKSLLKEALYHLLETGVTMGKFDEARLTVAELSRINEINHQFIDMKRVKLSGLEMAFMELRGLEAEKNMQELINEFELSETEKDLLNLKTIIAKQTANTDSDEYKDYQKKYQEIFSKDLQKLSPEEIQIFCLLQIFLPNQHIILNRAQGFDDDITANPEYLHDESRKKIFEIFSAINRLQKLQKNSPDSITPYFSIWLKEIQGELCGYLGDYKKAEQILGETWFEAQQSERSSKALKTAVVKAILELNDARCNHIIVATKDKPGKIILTSHIKRDKVLKALNTLTKFGTLSSKSTSKDNQYQLFFLTTITQAVELLLESYAQENQNLETQNPPQKEISMQRIRSEISPWLFEGLKSYFHINQYWSQDHAHLLPEGVKPTKNGYMQYNISPYLKIIHDFHSRFGLEERQLEEIHKLARSIAAKPCDYDIHMELLENIDTDNEAMLWTSPLAEGELFRKIFDSAKIFAEPHLPYLDEEGLTAAIEYGNSLKQDIFGKRDTMLRYLNELLKIVTKAKKEEQFGIAIDAVSDKIDFIIDKFVETKGEQSSAPSDFQLNPQNDFDPENSSPEASKKDSPSSDDNQKS